MKTIEFKNLFSTLLLTFSLAVVGTYAPHSWADTGESETEKHCDTGDVTGGPTGVDGDDCYSGNDSGDDVKGGGGGGGGGGPTPVPPTATTDPEAGGGNGDLNGGKDPTELDGPRDPIPTATSAGPPTPIPDPTVPLVDPDPTAVPPTAVPTVAPTSAPQVGAAAYCAPAPAGWTCNASGCTQPAQVVCPERGPGQCATNADCPGFCDFAGVATPPLGCTRYGNCKQCPAPRLLSEGECRTNRDCLSGTCNPSLNCGPDENGCSDCVGTCAPAIDRGGPRGGPSCIEEGARGCFEGRCCKGLTCNSNTCEYNFVDNAATCGGDYCVRPSDGKIICESECPDGWSLNGT